MRTMPTHTFNIPNYLAFIPRIPTIIIVLDYIETAVKQAGVDNLAYFYLGRAYHLNYRFDDAIRAYQHFKQNASSSDLKKHSVDRLIEMCNNGKQLLGNLHDLDVLRKKELGSSDYYQAYDLSENGGTLLTEPDEFKTKTDKKKDLTSIIYLSPDRTKLFFASYGDDDKNGKDIYVAYRLPNGAWGRPTNLGTVINTSYDEDYPFYDAPVPWGIIVWVVMIFSNLFTTLQITVGPSR